MTTSDSLSKETTFTPGPWWPCFDIDQPVPYYRGLVMYVSRDPHISVCTGSDGDKSGAVTCEREEWEANARLIAAAPELYEALTLIKRFGELACVDAGLGLGGSSGKKPASKDVFQFPRHLLTDIDAALSKARGEDRSQ